MLGLDSGRVVDRSAIIVSDDRCSTAIVVDSVGDIVEVPSGSIEPSLSVTSGAQIDHAEGSIEVDDRLVTLIDLEAVLEPIHTDDR